MAGVVADFDRERVYPSHVKKIISWYNILVESKQNDFSDPEEMEQPAE